MLSRKCSRDEPNHNIGAFFNTIDPFRTSTPEFGTAIYLIALWFGAFPNAGFRNTADLILSKASASND